MLTLYALKNIFVVTRAASKGVTLKKKCVWCLWVLVLFCILGWLVSKCLDLFTDLFWPKLSCPKMTVHKYENQLSIYVWISLFVFLTVPVPSRLSVETPSCLKEMHWARHQRGKVIHFFCVVSNFIILKMPTLFTLCMLVYFGVSIIHQTLDWDCRIFNMRMGSFFICIHTLAL